MKQLVLATNNKHKAGEFQSLMSDLGVEILTLDQFPQIGEIVEDADTLEGNAEKKAAEVFRATHLPTLADDSGLEVHYLNMEPGVFSSRYAGPGATYADNCNKLLVNLRGVPPRRRAARFRCVLCFLARDDGRSVEEGVCRGVIIESPRGNNGFGYDPIFLPDGSSRTLAEMSSIEKNSLSHRAGAVRLIRPHLISYFQTK
ncbi:MAG TPA: non-canonical purine NTP pyrophosphatase, RdgB/HAM1 family [Bacteroidetes bacterium]|nr:non-canonical purine NTP pyrophosphatase, RdgB/HAM1 family [Bacteroidota bacterium]